MKLNTLIIDDEPIALEKLRNYVSKVPFLRLIGSCKNGIEAADLMMRESVDVIFTDINMPDMNGMELISSLPVAPLVVFITAYAEYAVESYKLSAVDYLLKPYGFTEFQRAANKVMERYKMRADQHPQTTAIKSSVNPSDSMFIKTDYRYVRVQLSDIRYIKGFGEYLQIYTRDSAKPILTLSSFNSIKERLSENFIQVHRSFIVNMDAVETISKNRIILDANTIIPISESYKNAFQSYLSDNTIGLNQKKFTD